ncbi:cytochrome P450 4C1-like isoform X2 [Daktulosphaira vitifoliae]|uniref:cytochrome P450 4C1-like isoform X2 n=1 Tax=Daktulosphaira vitifoliae TaxID=58002 RepID=UPI0021AA4DED|nr:cytochrome P450 4C1-like isoform X2 [Daktulosphaira vitifoliae]
MLEFYILNVLWFVISAAISCIVISVCRNNYFPTEEQKLLDKLPSMTKGFWNFIKISFELGLTKPSGLMSFFLNAEKKYGRIYHFNLMGRSYVAISDPKDLKIVLSSTQHISKGPEYNMMRPWVHDGLFLSIGSKWTTRRKLLTNTFHYQTLDMYLPAINKHSQILTKKLLRVSQNEKKINIKEYIILCSMDIACQTIMGVNMNSQEGQSQNYVKASKNASKALCERIFKFWLWKDFIFKLSKSGKMFYASLDVLHRFREDMIKKKRIAISEKKNNKTSEENITIEKSKKVSFLELLIRFSDEYPNQMNDNDIKEEVDSILFGGFDTTSINLTVVLLLLGIYQDIQKLVRDELYNIFGDSDRDATMEDINNMKYLERVIKECLRIYPSIPQITRQLNDDLQLSNYVIPRNTVLIILPYVIHRNEELYPNPEKFDPERFLDEENKSKFLFSYIPFSAGPRNCIGQKFAMLQIKIIISTVLRQLKFKILGTGVDIKISSQIVLRFESLPDMEFSLIENNNII